MDKLFGRGGEVMISVLKALGSAVLVGAGVKAGGDLYQALRHRVAPVGGRPDPDAVDAEVTRRDGAAAGTAGRSGAGAAGEAAAGDADARRSGAADPGEAGSREADLEAERDRIDARRARIDTELDRLRRKREKQARRRKPAKA